MLAIAIVRSDQLVLFGKGGLEESEKLVSKTGIHSGCIIVPLLLSAILVPYHGSLACVRDAKVIWYVTWVCNSLRISCVGMLCILWSWEADA